MKEFITAEKIVEMLISGLISCAVALVVNCIIEKYKNKKRANVDEILAQDNISDSSHKCFSEIKIDIHDNANCTFHFHECTDPEKDQ